MVEHDELNELVSGFSGKKLGNYVSNGVLFESRLSARPLNLNTNLLTFINLRPLFWNIRYVNYMNIIRLTLARKYVLCLLFLSLL